MIILNKSLPFQILSVTVVTLILVACGTETDQAPTSSVNVFAKNSDTNRWYTQAQYDLGKAVFRKNCAVCHKQNAEGTSEWKKLDANGNYPPPPLNGSAHAWHHPLSVLLTVIRDGGGNYGGLMPGWKSTLSEEEMLATIAFFQSYWSDDVYEQWLGIEKSAQEQ